MAQPQVGCGFDVNVATVSSAGTAVQLSAAPEAVRRISVTAQSGNTGDIYLGKSDVDSTNGKTLSPGESVTLDFSPGTEPLDTFYVDAATNGDKAEWILGTVAVSGTLSGNHTLASHSGTLGVDDGGTGAISLTDGGVLLGSGTGAITAMAVLADGEIIVGDGTTDPVAESGATARTSLGVAIGTNVQAWDAFLDDIAALTDPGADRIAFWDDSAGAIVWLTVGSGITITATTMTVASTETSGMIAYFENSCPSGWTEYTAGRGRYVVGTPSGGTDQGTVGTALSDVENRAVGQHSHTATLRSVAGSSQTAFVGGSSVDSVTSDATNNAGSVAGTNAPYIQLTICSKD